jgi:DMSO/TMAO reductase YedYZ molybdopterin-dependent catalytic subunit
VVPRAEASHVLLHAYDGYTTNVPLADFAAPDAMLVHDWQGSPLTRDHGGPVRLVIPHLYFWKSAKWINPIEFLGADKAGFWEVNGYHMRGDPWAEERYSLGRSTRHIISLRQRGRDCSLCALPLCLEAWPRARIRIGIMDRQGPSLSSG